MLIMHGEVDPPPARPSIDRLMRPRSIAVVGASERADALGTRIIRNLQRSGYQGGIFPVNPRYGEVAGFACFPSLSALPEPVDAAFLAVPAAQGPALLDEAAACGIRAVFINANGYADGDASGVALQRRIEATAGAHGIAVAGPNNLGLINVHDGAAIWTPAAMPQLRKGPVALISQSGSVAIALAEDEREMGFAYVVTTGNEAVVTVADYLQHFAEDERVGVILLYVETIRSPEVFAAAAEEASKRNKPIVALKLGSSENGRALVQAHTGSLAGDDRLYDAFFRKLGIIRVSDPDEMLDAALLLSAFPKPRAKGGIVGVTLSGGEAALIADIGSERKIEFSPLSSATLERLRPAFPPYATIRNPLDAWGLGFNSERFALVLDALAADPDVGTIAFSVDAPSSGGADARFACIMAEACVALASRTDKHMVFFNNISGTGPNRDVRAILARAGIPYLSSIQTALTAIGHLQRKTVAQAAKLHSPAPAGWHDRALSGTEVDRFGLLADAGLPMAECTPVSQPAEAVEASQRLGFPVVLKGSARHLAHKSDLGLVRLGLKSAADVATAYSEIAQILRGQAAADTHEIYLQRMEKPGVELIIGIRNEPAFGSFILVGVGGIFVEVMGRPSIRLGPVDEAEALIMLRETPAGRLLDGFRGLGPYDAAGAARAIAALSQFGAATVGSLASIEINPLIVHETGAVGVDALIEPAGEKEART